ncbi:class I histocompatibility antigen, F10 alpha chain-like [Sparus aurata]|uniref:class I histocompatibility antigen, F10 alpha chain-like n=1 Tax=Sparus aurata TaxID=8175 RepID=UPI0011C0EB99|nr:class I histocompatibility antigen, F10 alpha chain-like [Sparus aurata]
MTTLLLLLLFCHVSSPVLYSLTFFTTLSTGIPNIPEFLVTLEIDELLLGSCDSNKKVEVKQDIAKSYCRENPEQLEWYRQMCVHFLPTSIKAYTKILSRFFNQTEGDHVVQVVGGCEWDDETEEVKAFAQIGYDGEDFMKLDPNKFTWIALRPEAFPAELLLDANKELGIQMKIVLTQIFPEQLKKYVKYGRSFLLRKGRIT